MIVDLITKTATERITSGKVLQNMLDEGMTHVLGRIERDGTDFIMLLRTACNLKLVHFVYFWSFPFTIFRLQLPQVSEIEESKILDKEELLYFLKIKEIRVREMI